MSMSDQELQAFREKQAAAFDSLVQDLEDRIPEDLDLGKAEDRSLRRLFRLIADWTVHSGGSEVKEFEIYRPFRRHLSVVISIGMQGDEGTAAELYCRHRCHFFIGSKGGLSWIGKEGGRHSGWKKAHRNIRTRA